MPVYRANEAIIRVRVRPRSRPGVEWRDGELVVSVAAAPVEGRATSEAGRALAAALGVPPGSVSLLSGPRARQKTFVVRGLGQEEALGMLEQVARPPG
jgi:uncharacterized protein YggU (UPF0235/DUF167 family)